MRVSLRDIQKMKRQGERIPMLTAYDYTGAQIAEAAGVPLLLVGDSLGSVVLGHETFTAVTLDDILHHVRPVVRGAKRALVVADLPFMTYQVSPEQALTNAGRLIQEGGAQAVKLEGGVAVAPTIRRIVDAGIPVMAHLGFTPQSVNQIGQRVQGKTAAAARKLLADALAVQEAGAFAVVLELVPAPLARAITERLKIPTIGIGAGAGCDGQVQVLHDLLGLFTDFVPRHAGRYLNGAELIRDAISRYIADVRGGSFPGPEHSSDMDAETLQQVLQDRIAP
jgi:3-methyl-2-oxobutanoate hydroxymethyltransferase